MKKLLFPGILLLSAASLCGMDFQTLPKARQAIYLNGVPHLGNDGKTRFSYDPKKSFFPLALYHPTLFMDETARKHPTPFDRIAKAGFNTLHHNRSYEEAFFTIAARYRFRIIKGGSSIEEALKWVDRPEILMWEVMDEPDGDGNFDAYPSRLEQFRKFYRKMREVDLDRPIFVNTVAWIENPNLPWLTQWHQISDVSCHDNYPKKRDDTPSWSGSQGIPESVSLMVRIVRESKPVLFIAQAFGEMDPPEPGERFHLAYPDPVELRSMVFGAIVMGAVGIDYFTLDNSVCRNAARLYGISPAPMPEYEGGGPKLHASPERLKKIRALWKAASDTNHDIKKLTPWLLSPTDPAFYEIAISGKPFSHTPIRAIMKTYNKRRILLLVNFDRTALDVKISMNRLEKPVKDFFTGEVLNVRNNEISFKMPEFGVKVLDIDR